MSYVPVLARVDFDHPLQEWDGFGVNYVETCQTRDYRKAPQDYGGFSVLNDDERSEILDLIFGKDGLRPGAIKMFLDPFHQSEQPWSGDVIDHSHFDHTTTTAWQHEFARRGMEISRSRGADLRIIVGLYGPPAWMTRQRQVRARDLHPDQRDPFAKYLAAYAHYLIQHGKLPVKYVSIHNEGESWARWPADGTNPDDGNTHDYNVHLTPEMVADMLPRVRRILDANGMSEVGVAPGETYSLPRFHMWGYADAIADDPQACAAIDLVTSHGFAFGARGRWYGDWRNNGRQIIEKAKGRPIKSWITSASFGAMDANMVWEYYQHIYQAGVNAIIPWACIQRPELWAGKDPNPGTCFVIGERGGYSVRKGYHMLKQVSGAGQPGTRVARTRCNDMDVPVIAFAGARQAEPNAMVIPNRQEDDAPKHMRIHCRGTRLDRVRATRTSITENEVTVTGFSIEDSHILYTAPKGSVTTFFLS